MEDGLIEMNSNGTGNYKEKEENEEKKQFFESLRAENEKVMKEYKLKMEVEFQNQLRGLLQELKSSKPSSPNPISPSRADQRNQAFFEAAKRQETAPTITIYEGNTKGVKLRATAENSDIIQPSAIDIEGNSLVKSDNKLSSNKNQHMRPGLEPYTQILMPKPSTSPKKKPSKTERLKEQEELKELNESIESQTKSDSYERYESRMLSTTREAVAKSQQILQDTGRITKKHKKGNKRKDENYDGGDRDRDRDRERKGRTSEIEKHENEESFPAVVNSRSSSSTQQQPYQTVVVSGSKSLVAATQSSKSLKSSSSFPKLGKSFQQTEDSDEFKSQFESSKGGQSLDSQKKENRYVPSDLSESEREGYLNKFDWENLLARHILSVYATSHSQSNYSETRAVMDLLEAPSSPPVSSNGLKRTTSSSSPSRSPSTALISPSKQSSRQSILKTNELKQTGLFDNLQKERIIVERKSIRPPVTGRSTIMMLGKATTSHQQHAASTSDLTAVLRQTNSRPSTAQTSVKDPVEDIGLKGVEKLKYSNRKQRNEINTTTQTSGMASVIRAPAKCFPIWFYSSGDVYAEWILLPNGTKLQSALDLLIEKKNYIKYTEIVGRLLDDCWIERMILSQQQQQQQHSTNDSTILSSTRGSTRNGTGTGTGTGTSSTSRRTKYDVSEVIIEEKTNNSLTTRELQALCRQYILVCNAFATICLENKDYSTAMVLIRTAEEWLKREDIFDNPPERLELKGYIHITFAFYFHKKKMTSASLSHSQQALEINKKLQKDDYIAMCLLMISCCKYQVSNFKESHRILYQILELVEEGKLAFHEANPKELCLIAVTYHNLAVIQMKLQVPDAAAKSSQNARKIARLCLSYSNRWITIFHWTHQLALEDVKYQLEHNFNLTQQQKNTMIQLTESYFDPHAL